MNNYFGNSQYAFPSNVFGLQRFFVAPNTNKIVVYSKEAALAQDFGVNTDVVCLDQEKPFLYNVNTDANGKRTVTTYQLIPYDEQAEQRKEQEKQLQGFVRVEQFNQLLAEVQDLKAKFSKEE